jgi:tetratricopeptide (TPR) repeat protein
MSDASPLREVRAAALSAALAALQGGRFAEAESRAGAWQAQNPLDLDAMLLRGLALAAQGATTRAAPLLQSVAVARPRFAHPCRDLASLLPDAPGLVAAQFRACRRLAPGDDRLALAYADFLRDAGRPAASAAVLRLLLRRAPRLAAAHKLLGMTLLDLGEPAGAITALRRATALDPGDAAAWSNLGVVLKIEGAFAESFSAHDRAVALAPDDPQLRLNRAVARLRAGRMAEAWPDYEYRLRLGPTPRLPGATLLPSLATLPEDLSGRTVLAWHEEGFGDTIQFARYLQPLAARGARVIAYVPEALARLFTTLAGVTAVLCPPAPVPEHDWHCPFFSLPRIFATTLETIPAPIPYLHADPREVAAWAPHVPAEGLRVGLVWAGQARPWLPGFASLDANRSTTLATLAPLATVPGLSLVSLQKGPAAAQVRDLPPGMVLADPMAGVHDFAATAAIIANLDVVVSVDTAVAHLAGALGRPVFLLDRYDNCWRWLAGREDSPWYPTLRIFRQPRMGDWAPVVEDIVAALTILAEKQTQLPL